YAGSSLARDPRVDAFHDPMGTDDSDARLSGAYPWSQSFESVEMATVVDGRGATGAYLGQQRTLISLWVVDRRGASHGGAEQPPGFLRISHGLVEIVVYDEYLGRLQSLGQPADSGDSVVVGASHHPVKYPESLSTSEGFVKHRADRHDACLVQGR